MGSELVDAATGRVLWGMANVDWYRRAWMSPTGMVTPAERAGDTTRITATRLLRFPAFAPMLRGFEPYTALTSRLRHVVREPGRVVEFPYDWRLSIEHNARQLMAVVERLAGNGARLGLVAHSMGGLIARYCTDVLGGAAVVRTVITLGTPFHGAAKAAVLLSHGTGAPIPLHRKRLRAFAATLPARPAAHLPGGGRWDVRAPPDQRRYRTAWRRCRTGRGVVRPACAPAGAGIGGFGRVVAAGRRGAGRGTEPRAVRRHRAGTPVYLPAGFTNRTEPGTATKPQITGRPRVLARYSPSAR
jgi:hypothetical protein